MSLSILPARTTGIRVAQRLDHDEGLTSGSLVGIRPRRAYDDAGSGSAGYKYAKLALANYIHELATTLAPDMIRANVIHPTNVNSPMLHNDMTYRAFRPDLENPTREEAEKQFPIVHAMPVPYVELDDITHGWCISPPTSRGT